MSKYYSVKMVFVCCICFEFVLLVKPNYTRIIKNLVHINMNLLLNLFFIAFALEPLQRLSAVALLRLALLLEDLDGLIEGLNGCALHLQLLWETRTQTVTCVHLMIHCISLLTLKSYVMLWCNFLQLYFSLHFVIS